MLTARIMHECVRKLLLSNPSDEEALECLCRLLTTVGKALEKETKDKLAKAELKRIENWEEITRLLLFLHHHPTRRHLYLEYIKTEEWKH